MPHPRLATDHPPPTTVLNGLKFAIRQLLKNSGLTAVAVPMLARGVGLGKTLSARSPRQQRTPVGVTVPPRLRVGGVRLRWYIRRASSSWAARAANRSVALREDQAEVGL